MRKLLPLLTVALVVVIAVERKRLYLRDPLGKVYRGHAEDPEGRVFLNYEDDILVENTAGPQTYRYVVQHWNSAAGVPARLTCLQRMACMADADHAATVGQLETGAVTMTDREVQFTDGAEIPMRVTLR